MEGAVLFSTRCMNMMLLKIFNWYIFKIFCSLKISPVCANLLLLKVIRIVCLLAVNFSRFVLQVLPQAILAYWHSRASKGFLSKKGLALYRSPKFFAIFFVFCIFNVFQFRFSSSSAPRNLINSCLSIT